jgi:uncharacterized protein YbjQ (UPF0145 family)
MTAFGSTLSTSGFLAVRKSRFEPLRQVQGTSVLSLGWQRSPALAVRQSVTPSMIDSRGAGATKMYFPQGSQAVQQYLYEGAWLELGERTAAYNDARTQALARLRENAREAGALAVVDVRLRRGKFAQAKRAIEFTALGTAIGSDLVDLDEYEPIPLVSLSGGDFWKLFESGYWPLGLVGGTSVVFIISGRRTKVARFRFSRFSLRNQEFEDYTEGIAQARLRAAGRLRQEAREVGATGVLGVEVRRERAERSDDNLMVTVDLLGNAIAPIERGGPQVLTYAVNVGKA